MDWLELAHVSIHFALAGFVDLWSVFFTCEFDITFNPGTFDRVDIQYKFHKFFESWNGIKGNVLVPDHMRRRLSFEPEVMEILPDRDLLLDELSPVSGEFFVIKIGDRKVMCAGTDHVKQRSNTVERATDEQNAPLCAKLCLSVAFRIVCLDHPDAFINQTFAGQSHVHESLIELLCDITVRTTHKAQDFLQVGAK